MRKLAAFLAFMVPLLAAAAPRVAVDQPVYDFGEVKEGVIVQHAFVIKNVGDEPLVFTRDPYTSCGCTVAALPKKTLMPGESIELVATFNSTGFGGRHVQKIIWVYTNDPVTPKLALTIKGYVRPAEPHERSGWYLKYELYLLVDVRSPEEYARAHLLGAVNIPLDELEERLSPFPKSLLIYLYDETGERSAEAARRLVALGYRFSRFLKGGLVGWQARYGNFLIEFGGEGALTFSGRAVEGGRYAVDPSRLLERYIVMLDVRAPEDYLEGHIAGSINVDTGTLPQWVASHIPKSAPQGARITIWCIDEDGSRACSAARYLRSQGYNAYCLLGGLEQWRSRYGGLLWVSSE